MAPKISSSSFLYRSFSAFPLQKFRSASTLGVSSLLLRCLSPFPSFSRTLPSSLSLNLSCHIQLKPASKSFRRAPVSVVSDFQCVSSTTMSSSITSIPREGDSVLVQKNLIARTLTLNRPRQLNALNFDMNVYLLLFAIGFLLLMVSFVKDREFQSFFAKGCTLLHVFMALWRCYFERRVEDLAWDWLRQTVGDVVLAASWVFFLIFSWREKYD